MPHRALRNTKNYGRRVRDVFLAQKKVPDLSPEPVIVELLCDARGVKKELNRFELGCSEFNQSENATEGRRFKTLAHLVGRITTLI